MVSLEQQTESIEDKLYNIKIGDSEYNNILQDAENFKNLGNQFVKENNYAKAIESFTKAIDLKIETPKNAIYYSNRAIIHMKMENYGLSLADANKAIEFDKDYVKAYYRRASSLLYLNKYDEALADLNLLLKHFPDDEDIKMKIQNTRIEKKKKLFAESIKSEEPRFNDLLKKINKGTENKSYSNREYSSLNSMESKEEIPIQINSTGPAFEAKIDQEWVTGLLEDMKGGKYISPQNLSSMIYDCKCILDKDPTLVDINVDESNEINVCGDTHGQYYDLLNLFKIMGKPSETNPFLFNGDFVDRGSFSVEVVITMIAYKLLLPRHFFLARGNHETKNMNKMYGFEGEVRAKYNMDIYELFSQLFNTLPLCHVINKKVFVAHGGLFSKDNVSLDEIRKIDRKREPPESGLMCELLWSDPCKENGRHPSKRGVGLSFGPDVTARFLEYNNLELVIRSHEVKQDGYEVEANGKLITVFSAPNYCDQMGNKGAVVVLPGKTMIPKFVKFEHVEHPHVPPMKYANPWMNF